MAEDAYDVAGAAAAAELREKGSRFLARVEPARDERSAKERLAAMAREHPDATHYCWAWRLGSPAGERSADAGEPIGTAGEPILRALRGAGLSDVVAVVARWYGGTNLGRGGLARAYGGVARLALEEVPAVPRWRYESLEVDVPYDRLGALERLVQPPRVELANAEYGSRVRCSLRVVPSRRAALEEGLAALGLAPEGG